jgi:hypothetical protein
MAKSSTYLNKYFSDNNFILIYPQQAGVSEEISFDPTSPSMYEPLTDNIERLEDLIKTVGKLFRKR